MQSLHIGLRLSSCHLISRQNGMQQCRMIWAAAVPVTYLTTGESCHVQRGAVMLPQQHIPAGGLLTSVGWQQQELVSVCH